MGPPLKGGVYQFFQWGMSLVSEGDFSTTRWGLKKSLPTNRPKFPPELENSPPEIFLGDALSSASPSENSISPQSAGV
jgi:hypothetical protein